MNDVCSLLLSRPEKEVGVLCSSILLEVSDDAGQGIVLRFFLITVEDAESVISARVTSRAVVTVLSLLYAVAPYPAELGVGGHYLPSPVVYSLYGILDYVRIDANILDVVLEAFMLCNRLLDVVAVIGQPLEPIFRSLEDKTSGTAFVKNNSFMAFNLYKVTITAKCASTILAQFLGIKGTHIAATFITSIILNSENLAFYIQKRTFLEILGYFVRFINYNYFFAIILCLSV